MGNDIEQQPTKNLDVKVIESFGSEWAKFDQKSLPNSELGKMFDSYFEIFPWDSLTDTSIGFDMGCGSGRWAKLVAPRVGHLNCIDPSVDALNVAQENLEECNNVSFFNSDSESSGIEKHSQDFGYSLGVLHHIPDTQRALTQCVSLLKPNAPFLVYLYYRFDNRPSWFRLIWAISETQRRWISTLPNSIKPIVTDTIAATIYWPLSRIARIAERLGIDINNFPLNTYKNNSFLTLRTDARDRFGTSLEQRFTRNEIRNMMKTSGLENISFSNRQPFWCAIGYKRG